jgi:putative hydrolase of the HAD superfamily
MVLQQPVDRAAFDANLDVLAAELGIEKGEYLWTHIYEGDAWERAKRGQITRDEMWVECLAPFGVVDEAAAVAFRERMFELASGIHPAMRQLVYDLRSSVRLAVLSNTAIRDMARWYAEEQGMEGVFELVVSSAAVGLAKPEPAIYHLTLEQLGLSPEAALLVDDMRRNVEAAEALGLPSILFTTPEVLRAELEARGL